MNGYTEEHVSVKSILIGSRYCQKLREIISFGEINRIKFPATRIKIFQFLNI
jgi:hypothetical protein